MGYEMTRLFLLGALLAALAAAFKMSPWVRRKMSETTRTNVGRWPGHREEGAKDKGA